MEEQQILQKINLDFARAGIPPRVFAKQGDNNMRVVAVSLYNDGKAYKVPGGYAVNVSAKKPDGKSVYNPATEVAGNVAYITLTQQKLVRQRVAALRHEVEKFLQGRGICQYLTHAGIHLRPNRFTLGFLHGSVFFLRILRF